MSDATEIVPDTILGGRLRLHQLRRGHRAGTDAVLLAAAALVEPGDRVVDVGAGVGTVGLALALRTPDLTGRLLEADLEAAALARQNCRLNGVEHRMAVVVADLFDPAGRRAAGLLDEDASVVVTNPPFFLSRDGSASPRPGKARAHVLGHAEQGLGLAGPPLGHGDWLRSALALLAPKGRFWMIHRPDALPALLAASEGRLGALSLRPVQARAEGPAIRILLSGIKGSRAPMAIARPLVLHDAEGKFTPEAAALDRGDPWPGDP